jgi:hypothetical protein
MRKVVYVAPFILHVSNKPFMLSHYAELHYAQFHYAECRGAVQRIVIVNLCSFSQRTSAR